MKYSHGKEISSGVSVMFKDEEGEHYEFWNYLCGKGQYEMRKRYRESNDMVVWFNLAKNFTSEVGIKKV